MSEKLTYTILSATVDFLENYSEGDSVSNSAAEIGHTGIETVKNFLSSLQLIEKNGIIKEGFFKNCGMTLAQQVIIEFTKKFKPVWLSKLSIGASGLAALEVEDPSAHQCLEMAEVFVPEGEELSDAADIFLTELNILYRDGNNQESRRSIETGRRGERLSFEIEKKENRTTPIQHYLLDNEVGYDLELKLPKKKRYIEVKSSEQSISRAVAHVSRYQINTAKDISKLDKHEYFFHFWSFAKGKERFAKIDYQSISPFIAKEKKGMEIPQQSIFFRNFEDYFQEKRD